MDQTRYPQKSINFLNYSDIYFQVSSQEYPFHHQGHISNDAIYTYLARTFGWVQENSPITIVACTPSLAFSVLTDLHSQWVKKFKFFLKIFRFLVWLFCLLRINSTNRHSLKAMRKTWKCFGMVISVLTLEEPTSGCQISWFNLPVLW